MGSRAAARWTDKAKNEHPGRAQGCSHNWPGVFTGVFTCHRRGSCVLQVSVCGPTQRGSQFGSLGDTGRRKWRVLSANGPGGQQKKGALVVFCSKKAHPAFGVACACAWPMAVIQSRPNGGLECLGHAQTAATCHETGVRRVRRRRSPRWRLDTGAKGQKPMVFCQGQVFSYGKTSQLGILSCVRVSPGP